MNEIAVRNTSTLRQYLNYIDQYPILSIEDERDLFVRYHNGDYSVTPTIVTHNLRYVAHVVFTKYANCQVPPEDLIQEGNIGLLESVPKYDIRQNVRFVAYAKYNIQCRINEYLRKNYSIVTCITGKNIKKIRNNYNKMDRSKLASSLSVREKDIIEYENIAKIRYISVDEQEGYDELELVCDADIVEELIEEEDNAYLDKVKDSLDILDDRLKDIFISRNLTDPITPMREISEKYGISIERVRQLENIAKHKLSEHLGFNVLKVKN